MDFKSSGMKQLQGIRIHKSCALILHVLVNYFLWPWHHSCMKSTRPAFYCLLFFRHHKYYAFDGYYDAWSIVGYKRFFFLRLKSCGKDSS